MIDSMEKLKYFILLLLIAKLLLKFQIFQKEDIAYAVEKILSENFDIENDEIINLSIGDFFEDSIEKEESIIEKRNPLLLKAKCNKTYGS